jgi:hypothetical protein
MLTLLFRVSERIATPTSVILMAVNSLVAFAYRATVQTRPEIIYPGQEAMSLNPNSKLAWDLWLVTVPIVCLGAPFGAYAASFFHRHLFIYLVILLDTVQLIAAFCIIQPWTTKETNAPNLLCGTAAIIFVMSITCFTLIAHFGTKYIPKSQSPSIERDDIEVNLNDSTSINQQSKSQNVFVEISSHSSHEIVENVLQHGNI